MLSIGELLVTGRRDILNNTVLKLLDRVLAIEQGSSLLEGTTLGLNRVQINEDKLDAEPPDVDNVVLPPERFLGNGVDIPTGIWLARLIGAGRK